MRRTQATARRDPVALFAERETLREAGARITRELRVEEYLRRRAMRRLAVRREPENGGMA